MSDLPSSEAAAVGVVIVGGGFAGLETLLALRALAGDRAVLTLVTASVDFAYRPAAPAEAFGDEPPLIYDLHQIAAELGVALHVSALEGVIPQRRRVRLECGDELTYDALVLATGGRPVETIPGALVFRDQRDLPRFRALFDQVAAGSLSRLVFAVPSRHCWSLPAYELALLCSHHAALHSSDVQVSIVSPEAEPLSVFGSEASRRVHELLMDRGIRFIGSSIPDRVDGEGLLVLQFAAPIGADRVVAVPEVKAARILGVPASWSGFLPTDACGRVEGLRNVYAAGDLTSFPVKQGGIAAQQADAVAQTIAARLGAPIKELDTRRILRARLLIGDGALVLRTELDPFGRPTPASVQHLESRRADDLKVFGRYLTPYLALHGSRLRARTVAA